MTSSFYNYFGNSFLAWESCNLRGGLRSDRADGKKLVRTELGREALLRGKPARLPLAHFALRDFNLQIKNPINL
jgi:hypothetical protein